ncbi:hypothetical protein CQW23_13889 [Capsicum baccatum]|uniref:Plant-specific domain TIGR01615 family protein n=1 Tax=Capsicum baccatum TaxID=33114 RepID=A0A2G2WHM0_CAPBA|nr:hypothetical protein CQW23_13889 [Capsicum baccatum]
MRSHERRAPVVVDGGGSGGNWFNIGDGVGAGSGSGGCYSHDSDPDLAAMVSEFLESSSAGAESWCSSDNDSGFSDFALLADRIALDKNSVDQYESDLTMVVHSLILSMTESCCTGKPETCNASCIRSYLVKLLQSCGYNADLCATKWQGCGKIPGGEHEYIEVISHGSDGYSERYIIDLDFRSHFEIARAVKSYNVVLSCLPPVYVGTVTKLKLYLQAMVEAAKCSLKQNSMPLPPWRSLAYLEAKWESSSQRVVNVQVQSSVSPSNSCHRHCTELLWRIKSCIGSEIKAKGFLVHKNYRKRQGLKIQSSHASPATP